MTDPNGSTKTSHPIVAAWCAFWFTREPAYGLGLVRIAFGLVAVIWTLTLFPDLSRVFGDQGAAPLYAPLPYEWSIFEIWPGETALRIGWGVLLVSAIALTVGWHSRVAAIVVFVLIHSFHRRSGVIFNAGDTIIIVVALVLALSSCGAALSLDQRRRVGSFWSAQTLARWPVRLLQVQMSLIYLVAVQAKLSNSSWEDGSASYYAWRTDGRWALIEVPDWLAGNALLVNMATWGTLALELALAILVWNRRLRFWVLGAGVVMHLTMMVTMNVGYFSLAMFVLYAAFIPWETVENLRPRKSNSADASEETPASPRGPDRS